MKKALIVDDDALIVQLLADLLKSDVAVTTAHDGAEAWEKLQREEFDLLITDIWMPQMNGLELLAQVRTLQHQPNIIVMSADDTPEVMLKAAKEQGHHFIRKPFKAVDTMHFVRAVLEKPVANPIEIVSAKPGWVEMIVPCDRAHVDHIHDMMLKLKADLPQEVRENVSQAFRELLMNAMEWGGHFDPSRKIRISYLRAKRMLLYRISDPGSGFNFEGLKHAAVNNPPDNPIEHMMVREEKGLRPGGLGILMTMSLVDELLYNEAQNEVVFVKYLE
jgi:CheY-like chemotaxis protein